MAALSFGVLGAMGATACEDSDSAVGKSSAPGDTVTNDTRDAETRAPATPDTDAPSGEPDAVYGSEAGYTTDATVASYPGVAECNSCACPAATSYCFGGATARAEPMGVIPFGGGDAAADAGAPACPMVDAGALGCTALPAGATTCASLISTLQATYSCYLVCASDGKQMTVYCPSP
jgi:hypothetical protein